MVRPGQPSMKPPLLSAAEVKVEYAELPKLLDAWLMVGYRQWWKRQNVPRKSKAKELMANDKLKGLSPAQWTALKNKIRRSL